MAVTPAGDRSIRNQTQLLIWRTVIVAASIGLVYWAGRWYDDFFSSMNATFSTAGMWRWFLASALMVAAGLLVGLMVLPSPHGRWWMVVPAAIPLLLGMAFPAWIWGWPGTRLGSWTWRLLDEFTPVGVAAVMWLMVGVILSGGLSLPKSLRYWFEESEAPAVR